MEIDKNNDEESGLYFSEKKVGIRVKEVLQSCFPKMEAFEKKRVSSSSSSNLFLLPFGVGLQDCSYFIHPFLSSCLKPLLSSLSVICLFYFQCLLFSSFRYAYNTGTPLFLLFSISVILTHFDSLFLYDSYIVKGDSK